MPLRRLDSNNMTAMGTEPPEETQTDRWRQRLAEHQTSANDARVVDGHEIDMRSDDSSTSSADRPEIDRMQGRADQSRTDGSRADQSGAGQSESSAAGPISTAWPELRASLLASHATAGEPDTQSQSRDQSAESIDVDVSVERSAADSDSMDNVDLADSAAASVSTETSSSLEMAQVPALPPAVPPIAQVPEWVPPTPQPIIVESAKSRRRAGILLVVASALALLSGVLGALWLGERSENSDLRSQSAEDEVVDRATNESLEEASDELRTLELENERLQEQLNDMSALVLELPEGRITEISVPFTPTFADEAENGRLIAVGNDGEFIIWGAGVDGAITDSGSVSGAPTGLFAATGKAWVATDSGEIEALSLVADVEGLPAVEVGPTSFLAPEERAYWTFSSATGEVVRRKKSDSAVTASVAVPVDVIDLAIGAGSVWALGDDNQVYRINTADLTVTPIEIGVDVVSITAGPDALWTLSAADGSLRRLDPVTGSVLVTVPVGRDPIDAVFAGSSVWVGLRRGSSLIEVDTRTAAVVSRTPLPSEPTALHEGESGVFVTTNGDPALLRVSSTEQPPAPNAQVNPEDETAETADE